MRRVEGCLIAAAFLAGAAGCGGTTKLAVPAGAVPTLPLRSASPAEVLAAYDGYVQALETFSASGDLSVSDLRKGQMRRLGVRVVARRGGRLYMKGSVAMVTAIEITSDGDHFWFRLPTKKKLWTGRTDLGEPDLGEEGEDAPYRALRPGDVTRLLVPEPLDPGPGESLVFEAEPFAFSLTRVRDAGDAQVAVQRVWLTRDELELAKVWLYDEEGNVRSEARYGAFEDGLPHRVSIERPVEGYRAAFDLEKVVSNVDVPEAAFTGRVPDNHEVVVVE